MMQQSRRMKRLSIPGFLLPIMLLLFLVFSAVSPLGMAHAMSPDKEYRAQSSCPGVGAITSQSLLVVLLDRSGSLTFQPGATDPNGYSTSVTKALADLWPGSMAVVPFSKDTTPVLGPVTLADQGQRDSLKNQVQNYPIGGDTPLAPALHKALDLLKTAPSGSRAVIVTDGNPDPDVLNGVNQADDIRMHLIPQLCAQGKPVSAFGLALDLTQPSGQAADRLLQDIATGTGGAYTNVRNSQDLAQVVIKLYADWQHLIFVQMPRSGDNYTTAIDTYAQRVAFVTFRTDTTSKITLSGPGGPIPNQVIQRSTDRHYEIDSLVLSDVNQPGSYTVNASGDSGAHAYALVESRLHAILNKPKAQTTAHIGQPIQIEAELYNDGTPVVPQPNEATVNAHVSILVNGQTVSSQDVELVQEKDSALFTRQITLSGPVGQVKIEIRAVYRQIPVEASGAQIIIPLGPRIIIRKPPVPVPACGTNLKCYWQRYSTPILIGTPLVLVLLLLLLWLLQKGPYGSLTQSGHMQELGSMRRPLLRRLLSKSVLSSRELEDYGEFEFGGAGFDLVFGRGVSIRAKGDTPPLKVRSGRSYQQVKQEDKEGVALASGDAIHAGSYPPATYSEETPP